MFLTIVSHACSTVATAKASGARTSADTGLQRNHTTDPQMIKRISEGAAKPGLLLPFFDAHETPLAHFLAQPILNNFLDAFLQSYKGRKNKQCKTRTSVVWSMALMSVAENAFASFILLIVNCPPSTTMSSSRLFCLFGLQK